MKTLWKIGARSVAAILFLGLAGTLTAAETTEKSTLDNLQTAFNLETNAKTRFEAFAVKADEEGFKSVAGLFRAAANAAAVQIRKHTAAIKKLGAEPKAAAVAPEVKSTKENLDVTVKNAAADKDALYAAAAKQAEADKNTGAMYAFAGASAAAESVAKLAQQALGNLDAWKAPGKEFMVCQVCGFTTMDKKLKKCPVCAAPRTKFDTVK